MRRRVEDERCKSRSEQRRSSCYGSARVQRLIVRKTRLRGSNFLVNPKAYALVGIYTRTEINGADGGTRFRGNLRPICMRRASLSPRSSKQSVCWTRVRSRSFSSAGRQIRRGEVLRKLKTSRSIGLVCSEKWLMLLLYYYTVGVPGLITEWLVLVFGGNV